MTDLATMTTAELMAKDAELERELDECTLYSIAREGTLARQYYEELLKECRLLRDELERRPKDNLQPDPKPAQMVRCETCNGKGYHSEPGLEYSCRTCNGTGQRPETPDERRERETRETEAMTDETEDDICGLCGNPGADKMAKWTGGGIYWPGEEQPDTEMVHSECEDQECRRAHARLSQSERYRVIDDASKYGPNPIPKRFMISS